MTTMYQQQQPQEEEPLLELVGSVAVGAGVFCALAFATAMPLWAALLAAFAVFVALFLLLTTRGSHPACYCPCPPLTLA